MDNEKKVSFDVFVWTGGIKAPEVLSALPLHIEARGQLTVSQSMQCLPQTPDLSLHAHVSALGDATCLYNPITKRPIPAVARAAISQADVVAHNVIEDIKAEYGLSKTPNHLIYEPHNYPYITPVGGKYAVAKIGPFTITGFWGWFLKGLVELNYLFSIMPFWKAFELWLKGLKIFIENDRLG